MLLLVLLMSEGSLSAGTLYVVVAVAAILALGLVSYCLIFRIRPLVAELDTLRTLDGVPPDEQDECP